jgi:hypothetical protein
MKKITLFLSTIILVFGMAGAANAVLYSYDFSTMGYSNGQILEGMVQDSATFTSEATDLRYYSTYGGGIGTGFTWGAAADTYISFSTAVDSLSFTAGDGGGDFDAFRVSLYAFGTDAFIGSYSSPVFGGTAEPEWYTLNIAAANIGRVVFDPGNGGVLPGIKEDLGGVVITDMSYNTASVPEPSTLLLLGSGLVGLGFIRRKFNR